MNRRGISRGSSRATSARRRSPRGRELSDAPAGGDKVTLGQAGEEGARDERERRQGRGVMFPGNTGNISCFLTQLSRASPPPLPGGYAVGEKVYYTGRARRPRKATSGPPPAGGRGRGTPPNQQPRHRRSAGVSRRSSGNKGNASEATTGPPRPPQAVTRADVPARARASSTRIERAARAAGARARANSRPFRRARGARTRARARAHYNSARAPQPRPLRAILGSVAVTHARRRRWRRDAASPARPAGLGAARATRAAARARAARARAGARVCARVAASESRARTARARRPGARPGRALPQRGRRGGRARARPFFARRRANRESATGLILAEVRGLGSKHPRRDGRGFPRSRELPTTRVYKNPSAERAPPPPPPRPPPHLRAAPSITAPASKSAGGSLLAAACSRPAWRRTKSTAGANAGSLSPAPALGLLEEVGEHAAGRLDVGGARARGRARPRAAATSRAARRRRRRSWWRGAPPAPAPPPSSVAKRVVAASSSARARFRLSQTRQSTGGSSVHSRARRSASAASRRRSSAHGSPTKRVARHAVASSVSGITSCQRQPRYAWSYPPSSPRSPPDASAYAWMTTSKTRNWKMYCA